jgi:hypothetical protein
MLCGRPVWYWLMQLVSACAGMWMDAAVSVWYLLCAAFKQGVQLAHRWVYGYCLLARLLVPCLPISCQHMCLLLLEGLAAPAVTRVC